MDKEIADAEAGLILGAHFGINCSSWSRLNMLFNGGTRTALKPEGLGTLSREVQGNQEFTGMMRLVVVLHRLGIPVTIENPETSMIWNMPELLAFVDEPDVNSVVFDQCMFGLLPPDHASLQHDVRVRKRTKLVGSAPHLCRLHRVCDRAHQHSHAYGDCRVDGKRVKRAKAAGIYPESLCRQLAACFV